MNYFDFSEETNVKLEEGGRRVLCVDINPEKSCIFWCLPCLRKRTVFQNEWHDFGPVEDSLQALGEKIEQQKPDIVQVYGKGEPLTNVRLGEVIDFIHSKGVPVRLLSNAYLLGLGKHMEFACKCDEVIGAMGTVNEPDFAKLHRPLPEMELSAAQQRESLLNFSKNYTGKFVLRVFFVKDLNDSDEKVAEIKALIDQAKYDVLWIETTPVLTVDDARMQEIRKALTA